MKLSYLLSILFLFLMLSCSTEEQDSAGPEEYSTVGFDISGEFSTEKRPLRNSETGPNDLFAMQFFELGSQNPYAYVLGDDISKVQVEFVRNRSYLMKMTLIKDGKNRIKKIEESWAEPFHITGFQEAALNEAYYSSQNKVERLSDPYIHVSNQEWGHYFEVDRYHGMIAEFSLSEENEQLSIDLNRVVFGLNLQISLEGKEHPESFYFSINPEMGQQRSYVFPAVDGKGSVEIPFLTLAFPQADHFQHFVTELDKGSGGEHREEVHISIGTPDHQTLYFDDFISVSRNKMTTIELTPSGQGDHSKGGMELTFEEEMLEKYIEL